MVNDFYETSCAKLSIFEPVEWKSYTIKNHKRFFLSQILSFDSLYKEIQTAITWHISSNDTVSFNSKAKEIYIRDVQLWTQIWIQKSNLLSIDSWS